MTLIQTIPHNLYVTLFVILKNKSNKMLQTIWHHFSVQFSLLFQMVHSILLSVLHLKTILLVDRDWLFKFFHQSPVGVLKGKTASKMEHSFWRSNEHWIEKCCQIVCSILFDLFLCMTSSLFRFTNIFYKQFDTMICIWVLKTFTFY